MSSNFQAVQLSDEEVPGAETLLEQRPSRFSLKKVGLAVALGLGVVALGFAMPSKRCAVKLGAFQGLSEEDVNAKMVSKAMALKSIANRSMADNIVLKAMKDAGHDYAKHFEDTQVRTLPADPVAEARAMATYAQVKATIATKKQNSIKEAETIFCAFNIMEAFVSVVGMGDDINAIIRTCPAPRDGESELACQVDGGILVAWVGNAATKLAFAASNCAITTNVNALCSVGVTGLVSVMGELAATASLAAATCTPTPPQLTTSKISVLGDQTVRDRRLLIGEGPIGVGVQCAVNVGMVAANIANMGISVFLAAKKGFCGRVLRQSALNKVTGIPDALCTVDIGGAIAYMSQVVTFINLIVIHCQDFLDVSALCGGSISGIITSAAAIAPYGAAVHAACAKNTITKNGELQGAINSLYTVPQLPRRLGEMDDAMTNLQNMRRQLEDELHSKGINITRTRDMYDKSAMEKLMNLMDGRMESEAEVKSGILGLFGQEEEECVE
mmetsp:Transcript_13163/g.31404  ORF Transcript_13163/g.31404 Transcript_13163/m.31404 type:complete len:500 (+) Transcript_13163:98-1597(+)